MTKEEAMKVTKKWIEEEYGGRCDVCCYNCPICEMWLAYDRLFSDIDKEYSWMKSLRVLAEDEFHSKKRKHNI